MWVGTFFSCTDLRTLRACNVDPPELVGDEKGSVLSEASSINGSTPKRLILRDILGYKGRKLSHDSFISSLDAICTNDGTNSMFCDLSKRTESSRETR